MKTRILSFMASAVAVVALLTGCSTENDFENGRDGLASLELSSVSSSDILTRAVIDGVGFPTDKGNIGLFLYADAAASQPYGGGYENVQYSYDSDKKKWTASPSIKVGSTQGYLYGYYPYSSTATDIKEIPVASSLNGDDVMYATTQTVTDATASQTSITMNHALARVSITVKNNGYTGAAKLTKIKFAGAEIAPTGTLNATNGSITATKSDVTLDVTGDAQTITAAGTTYECLLVPSAVISDEQTVKLTLTIDGIDKEATLSENNGVIIAKGTKSNITITLSNSGISVSSVSIDEWKEVEVGGHKVTVKLAEISNIEKDIMFTAYAEGTSVLIKAYTESGRPIECVLSDDKLCDFTKNNNVYTFTISDITSDLTAEVGYTVVHSVSLNTDALKLIKDYGHYRLVATVLPEEAEDKTLIWSSSNESVATVDQNGYVKAFATGSAIITVESKIGGCTTTCAVTVVESQTRPDGSLIGHFSVSDNTVVYFSRGNLWCEGEGTNQYPRIKSWGFEMNQYESTPDKAEDRYLNHISHFFWCKNALYSLYPRYNMDYYGGYIFTNSDETTPSPDFVVNGQKGVWRALSGGPNGEWKYLINAGNECGQTIRSGKYKCCVKVCGHNNCLILLPDDWKWGENGVGSDWQNEYSETTTVTWSDMESAGAVCLPAAGYRDGNPKTTTGNPMLVDDVESGYYWSSTPRATNIVYYLYFNTNESVDATYNSGPHLARSVRLVTEVK